MSSVLHPGDKIHVSTRRSFVDDIRRHFVGMVEAVEGELARLRGHVFVYHQGTGEFERRPKERILVLGIGDAMQVINVLPADIDLGAVHYTSADGRLVVTDGKDFVLDVNEFGPRA